MFADALLDSHHQSRRGLATLTSFGIQAIFIACLLILPLLYTQVLPQMRSTPRLIARFGDNLPQPTVPAQPAHNGASVNTTPHIILLMQPRQISAVTTSGPEIEAPNLPLGPTGSFSNGPGLPDGVRNALDQVAVRVTPPPTVTIKAPRVSVMMEGSLIRRVDPIYPSPAKSIRVQGTVVLAAVIGTDGSVQKLQVMSGHPMLVQSAINAVSQWRYRPYVLNGSPIEVDTRITVNFILAQ